jgi:hypothetical protein
MSTEHAAYVGTSADVTYILAYGISHGLDLSIAWNVVTWIRIAWKICEILQAPHLRVPKRAYYWGRQALAS